MDEPAALRESIAAALNVHGLAIRGGLDFTASEGLPTGDGGSAAKSVLLLGNIGGTFWPHFCRWLAGQPADIADPLDTWSREIIDGVASETGAMAVYPSDKPYLPFQQWAMRAEGLKPSPLAILMHPEYGLWHAYRGALLFDIYLDLPQPRSEPHLCETCASKPCKKACPVDAHARIGFEYRDCLGHLRSDASGECMTSGCLDRNACPNCMAYRYPSDMQAFLMSSFAR